MVPLYILCNTVIVRLRLAGHQLSGYLCHSAATVAQLEFFQWGGGGGGVVFKLVRKDRVKLNRTVKNFIKIG